jgi:transposase InsO family protein
LITFLSNVYGVVYNIEVATLWWTVYLRETHHKEFRIANRLAKQGVFLSRRRISSLMMAAGLSCKTKRKYKVTTDSNHNRLVAPNLLKRQFHVAAPNRYWVGYITYILTKNGWLN